jgi:tetratricopeptide (TPR) repeat protein
MVGTVNSQIVVVKRPSRRRQAQRIVVIATGVIILLLIGFLSWKFILRHDKPTSTKSLQKTTADVSKNIQDHSYGKAQNDLESFIANTKDQQEKINAQINLATVYSLNGRLNDALALIQELEKNNNDLGYSAYTLAGGIYEKQGNKAEAKRYYEKAVTSMKQSAERSDDLYIKQYEAKINQL